MFFAFVVTVSVFCQNPVMLFVSLAAAVTLYLLINGKRNAGTHFAAIGAFAVIAAANPFFSHNGATVLFFVNNNPITLEAAFYGLYCASTVAAVIYWLGSFSQIMTSDRLMYVFARVSPKLALILSMSLRFIPLFTKQIIMTNNAQKAMGLYKEEKITDRLAGSMRTFSIVVTWALENGIVTADSMASRGYCAGKRSSFATYRFSKGDLCFCAVCAALFAAAVLGNKQFEFYPVTVNPPLTLGTAAAYLSFGTLAFLPSATEMGERLRWKYCLSKI